MLRSQVFRDDIINLGHFKVSDGAGDFTASAAFSPTDEPPQQAQDVFDSLRGQPGREQAVTERINPFDRHVVRLFVSEYRLDVFRVDEPVFIYASVPRLAFEEILPKILDSNPRRGGDGWFPCLCFAECF